MNCCVCSPSTLSSLYVLHHWIFKTKTETKTEYENKSMIVRINWFKKKKKRNERVVVCSSGPDYKPYKHMLPANFKICKLSSIFIKVLFTVI